MSRANKLYIVGVIIMTCILGMVITVGTSNVVAKSLANEEQYTMVEEYHD